MFDFVQLDTSVAAEEGVWTPIVHPVTKQPVAGAEVLIASYDSEHAKEQKRKVQKRRAKQGRPVTPEEIEEDTLAIVCSVVRNWRGIAWQGPELACTVQNKLMILERLDWLRRFVDTVASETGNFLPPSVSSSSNSPSTNGDLASDPPAAN